MSLLKYISLYIGLFKNLNLNNCKKLNTLYFFPNWAFTTCQGPNFTVRLSTEIHAYSALQGL